MPPASRNPRNAGNPRAPSAYRDGFAIERTDYDRQRDEKAMREAEVLQGVDEAERLKMEEMGQGMEGMEGVEGMEGAGGATAAKKPDDFTWIPIDPDDVKAWMILTDSEKKAAKKWEDEVKKNVKLVEGNEAEWQKLATPHRGVAKESEATLIKFNPIATNVIADQRAIIAKHPEYDVEPMLPEMEFEMPDGSKVEREVALGAASTSHLCTFIAANTDERNQFRSCIFDLLTANRFYYVVGSLGQGSDFSTRATWVDREGRTYKRFARGKQTHGLAKNWLPYGLRLCPTDVIEDPWCKDPHAANHISHDFIKPIVEVENSPMYRHNKGLVDNLSAEDRAGGQYERLEVDGVKDKGYVKLREIQYRYASEDHESGMCVVFLTIIRGQDKKGPKGRGGGSGTRGASVIDGSGGGGNAALEGGYRVVRHQKLKFDTGGRFTIQTMKMINIPDDLKGFTMIRFYKYLVGDANTLLSMNLKWTLLAMPRIFASEELFTQRASEKFEIQTMDEVTLVDGDLKDKMGRIPIDPPPPTVEAFAATLLKLANEMSGRSMNQRLQTGARTATESANVAGEAEAQRSDIVETFKEFAGEQMKLKLKFLAYALPAMDENGQLRKFYLPDGTGGFHKFDLIDILMDYAIRMNYESTMWRDEAVLIHQAMEILQLLMRLPPGELGRIDWKPILAQILVSFGPSWTTVRRKMMTIDPKKDMANPDTEHVAFMLGNALMPSDTEDFEYTIPEHMAMLQRATTEPEGMGKLWNPETIQILVNHILDSAEKAKQKGQSIPKVLEEKLDEKAVREAMGGAGEGEGAGGGEGGAGAGGGGGGPDYTVNPGEVMTPANAQPGSGIRGGRMSQAPSGMGGVPMEGDMAGSGTAGVGRIL